MLSNLGLNLTIPQAYKPQKWRTIRDARYICIVGGKYKINLLWYRAHSSLPDSDTGTERILRYIAGAFDRLFEPVADAIHLKIQVAPLG